MKAAVQTGSAHASRCWTGRGDPVGSTGSQRLSGSGVPTIGGGGPGGEVSRVSHPSRGRRSTDRPGADVEPCGKPAREPCVYKLARTRTTTRASTIVCAGSLFVNACTSRRARLALCLSLSLFLFLPFFHSSLKSERLNLILRYCKTG